MAGSHYNSRSNVYAYPLNPIGRERHHRPFSDNSHVSSGRNLSRSVKAPSSNTDQAFENYDSNLKVREKSNFATSLPYSQRKADQRGSQINSQSYHTGYHGGEMQDVGNLSRLNNGSMRHTSVGTDRDVITNYNSDTNRIHHTSGGRLLSPKASIHGDESRETHKSKTLSSRTYTNQMPKSNTISTLSGSHISCSSAKHHRASSSNYVDEHLYKNDEHDIHTQYWQSGEKGTKKFTTETNAYGDIGEYKYKDNSCANGNETNEYQTYRNNARHQSHLHDDVRSENVSDNSRDRIIYDSPTKYLNNVKQHSSVVSDILNNSSQEQQQQNISGFAKGDPQSYVNPKTSNVSSRDSLSLEKQTHQLTAENSIHDQHIRVEVDAEIDARSKPPISTEKHQWQINDIEISNRKEESPPGTRYRDDGYSSSSRDYRRSSAEKERYKNTVDDRPVNDKYMSDKEKDKQIEMLKKMNIRLRQEKKEIERRTNELTKLLSRQMKNSNHFENCDDDLSTSKIAKRFKLLYDDKWVQLCKWMMQTFRQIPEVKIIQCLSLLIKSCYKECLNMADNQVRQFLILNESDDIPMYEKHPELFALRKQYAQTDTLRLQVKNIVKDKVHVEKTLFEHCQESKTHGLLDRVETFLDEYIDCCWLMTVSRPTMSLNFDVVGKMYSECADQFSVLSLKRNIDDPTKTAGTVYEVVWPSVHLKFESELYTKGDAIVITNKTKDAFSQT
ncbi:uncharacterized protein LOC132723028 [Ruditapes philippinarum]|uniref:uncharacterized protein LOC132723028 n=1 Tax=Ruditapes philippinarum TaxID=129788 RepID=UPI00295B6FB7|nr:uncharacterized protein LOC132723028 [Ruditapes philippinarum]XP_060563669.1 uncharacterized protein LOC132723028 [Ruditapes philippinarum]